MRLTPEPNISDRLEIVVDHAAEATDWDEALIEFAIAFVRGGKEDE